MYTLALSQLTGLTTFQTRKAPSLYTSVFHTDTRLYTLLMVDLGTCWVSTHMSPAYAPVQMFQIQRTHRTRRTFIGCSKLYSCFTSLSCLLDCSDQTFHSQQRAHLRSSCRVHTHPMCRHILNVERRTIVTSSSYCLSRTLQSLSKSPHFWQKNVSDGTSARSPSGTGSMGPRAGVRTCSGRCGTRRCRTSTSMHLVSHSRLLCVSQH